MGYRRIADDIVFDDMVVDRADCASFVPLAWGWAKDRDRVYFCGCAVDHARPSSFVPLSATFGCDGEHVFAGRRTIECEVGRFRVIGGGYAIDGRAVFYSELRLGWLVACWTLETADPRSFMPLAHRWAIDAAHIYCEGAVVDGDPESLLPLSRRIARDRHRVLVGARVLDADAATFRLLDDNYGIDRAAVYFGDILATRIDAADRASFRPLGDTFAIDASFAYWTGSVLAGIDPTDLRVLSASFIATSDQVLYLYSGIHRTRRVTRDIYGLSPLPLAGADPTTFRDLGELYGADDQRAYYHGSPLAVIGDPRQLRTIGARLARDDRAVYYEYDLIEGADPASFRIVAPAGVARDRARWYVYNPYDDYPQVTVVDEDRAREALAGEPLAEDSELA